MPQFRLFRSVLGTRFVLLTIGVSEKGFRDRQKPLASISHANAKWIFMANRRSWLRDFDFLLLRRRLRAAAAPQHHCLQGFRYGVDFSIPTAPTKSPVESVAFA